MQSADSKGRYVYRTSKELVRNKEEMKCNNIKNNTKNE